MGLSRSSRITESEQPGHTPTVPEFATAEDPPAESQRETSIPLTKSPCATNKSAGFRFPGLNAKTN